MTLSMLLPSYTAFDGHRRVASGPLATVAVAVRQAAGNAMSGTIVIFDDATGRSIDLDLRGTADEHEFLRLRVGKPPDGLTDMTEPAGRDGEHDCQAGDDA